MHGTHVGLRQLEAEVKGADRCANERLHDAKATEDPPESVVPDSQPDPRRDQPPEVAHAYYVSCAVTGDEDRVGRPLRIHIPHRRGIDELVGIRPINISRRILPHPSAEARGAVIVAGYRCSVFGIALVDATVRTNVVIATHSSPVHSGNRISLIATIRSSAFQYLW